mmetsp:Transcript_96153/g.206299  ORF Transcript_96153/g.206299 Transcript_96153/m.206299 type:complete len:266 (-) Transcript_96153:285-1082(-)
MPRVQRAATCFSTSVLRLRSSRARPTPCGTASTSPTWPHRRTDRPAYPAACCSSAVAGKAVTWPWIPSGRSSWSGTAWRSSAVPASTLWTSGVSRSSRMTPGNTTSYPRSWTGTMSLTSSTRISTRSSRSLSARSPCSSRNPSLAMRIRSWTASARPRRSLTSSIAGCASASSRANSRSREITRKRPARVARWARRWSRRRTLGAWTARRFAQLRPAAAQRHGSDRSRPACSASGSATPLPTAVRAQQARSAGQPRPHASAARAA